MRRGRDPHFAAVDDVAIAIWRGRRAQGKRVGARLGLREAETACLGRERLVIRLVRRQCSDNCSVILLKQSTIYDTSDKAIVVSCNKHDSIKGF